MRRREMLLSGSSLTLALVLTLGGLVPPAAAQRRPINISFGQPNIWSLEQAHYLLARMRDQSLDLRTRMPDGEDLNPNAPNGARLRSLRTFFGAGVNFDQAAGLQNRLFRDNARFSSTRRETLLTTRDQLQTELRAAAAEHSRLKIERSLLNLNGATDAQKAHKDVEVTEAAAREQRLTTDLAGVDRDLAALNVPAGALTTATPPDAATSRLSEGIVDSLLESEGFRSELSNDVRLNASTVLENHVQMQYEIIAKQLTLLRDEVGPGERLVFLELPHSIYTVPDKANRRLAQVWWHVDGFHRKLTPSATPAPATSPTPCPTPGATPTPQRMPFRPDKDARQKSMDANRYGPDRPKSQEEILRQLSNPELYTFVGAEDRVRSSSGAYPSTVHNSRIRTVDLIPRQSSLNVNDIQDKVKNFNLAGAFNFLFGLGARVDFQRQRRLYEQFMHQDIFASAFGKGATDFGWTFGPVPGTERIAPGLHTTYAVLVVPDDAEVIQLTARGCHMRRTDYAPNDFNDTREDGGTTVAARSKNVQCSDEGQTFRLVVPGTSDNNFWVKAIDYTPVKPGERAVVMVEGEYFSPQMGVLVDGVPLRRAVGVAQVEVISSHRDDPYVPDPRGEYELVNSKLLVMAFTMPRDFKGTPSIALLTPGRARVINDLRVVVNNSYKFADGITYKPLAEDPCTPEEHSVWVRLSKQKPLFAADAPGAALSVGRLRVLRAHAGLVTAHLTGTRFEGKERIFVNGTELSGSHQSDGSCPISAATPGCKRLETETLYTLTFPSENAEEWHVTVIQTTATGGQEFKTDATATFPNPSVLKVTAEPLVLSFDADTDPAVLSVKLVGSGFVNTIDAVVTSNAVTTARFDRVSSREGVLVLTRPEPVVVVALTDRASGHTVPIVVKRPPPPPPKPRPKYEVFERNGTDEEDGPPR